MKKLTTLVLGIALSTGVISTVAHAEPPKKEKKAKKPKAPKKKKGEPAKGTN